MLTLGHFGLPYKQVERFNINNIIELALIKITEKIVYIVVCSYMGI